MHQEIRKFKSAPVFFTDRKKVKNFENIIKILPKNSAIIVREYDLDQKSRENFANKIIALARKKGIKILIGKDFYLAKKLRADGLHFSDFDQIPTQFRQKNLWPKNFIFSFASHSFESLLKLQKSKPNMIFLSPIFSTTSHKTSSTFGLINLAKITFKNKSRHNSNIYALGGINSGNIKSLQKLPIKSFGAIDFFLEPVHYLF